MSVSYDVSFNTVDDSWLTTSGDCVQYGYGYGAIRADASSLSTHCEHFELIDLNGGDLVDGDEIAVRSVDSSNQGHYYWSSYQDDLFALEVCACSNLGATFYLYDQDCTTSGCTVQGGHKLVFQNTQSGKYIHAVGGGGGDMDTSATSGGTFERLEIIFH
jgi:hypothetical protein